MKLFEQAIIGTLTLKNRFFRAATWEGLADNKGHMTNELFAIHEELAQGGVGAIITGYSFVTENEQANPGMMGIYNDSFIEEYKTLTQMVHSYDAKIFLQIAYGGSSSTLNPPSKNILGASAIANERTGIIPIEMTKTDINELKEAFVSAAKRAKEAGFDGVQIHSAHGYLLSLFLCPFYNRRTDEYGGSIENRARCLLEIVQSTRVAVGNDFPILVKINSEDFMPEGLTAEDSITVTKLLENAGIDAIEISGGNIASSFTQKNNLSPTRTKLTKETESYFSNHAKELTKHIQIPIILTGGNRNYDYMEELYVKFGIAFFALSRPLIAQTDLINKWKENTKLKAACISCNACFSVHGKRCIFNVKKT